MNNQELVRELAYLISQGRMENNLKKFTSFFNRHYKSDSGLEASKWLFNEIETMIKVSNATHISAHKFHHDKWKQFSIIVKFDGVKTDQETVILSAHLDSTAGFFGAYNRAPGADDDGSGSITVLEVLQILVQKKFRPNLPVEIHFYSAEEGGLLGSQDVVSSMKRKNRKIAGTLQIDMDGFNSEDVIALVTDFTNKQLTGFLKDVAETYTSKDVIETQCGYACSDHASFTKAGYPSTFAIEASFKNTSPFIHSDKDVVSRIDFPHVEEFVKMALGFVVEMSLQK
ncbi:putative aminopeptidase [Rozella allomycis CSF55]|uniref:Peptide hydrolase n=1 Tax=Rozella allomycis (strain CSF55) TaxID=988480 RepID=A0A4P9YI98_ROZAC|nr:putative aminopeptidase [Rozella allomycis CSF55]